MSTRSSLTVVSGTTITSAWGNGVRDHIVPKTTSDDVSSEGQLAANTSTNRIVVHDGSSARTLVEYGAWADWIGSAGIVQGAGGASSYGVGSTAKYTMIGRTVHWEIDVTVASVSAPTAGSPLVVGLPVAARDGFSARGYGFFYDASVPALYPCVVMGTSSTTESFLYSTASAPSNALGSIDFTAALAVGDVLRIGGTYEAAS